LKVWRNKSTNQKRSYFIYKMTFKLKTTKSKSMRCEGEKSGD